MDLQHIKEKAKLINSIIEKCLEHNSTNLNITSTVADHCWVFINIQKINGNITLLIEQKTLCDQ